jgi:hypothetical protein
MEEVATVGVDGVDVLHFAVVAVSGERDLGAKAAVSGVPETRALLRDRWYRIPAPPFMLRRTAVWLPGIRV